MSTPYTDMSPSDVQPLTGLTVLDFGTNWCGICQSLAAGIEAGLEGSSVPHIKVEDGPGRPLGRSYRVKLWPTLVFLRDGVEVARRVRPGSAEEVAAALATLEASA